MPLVDVALQPAPASLPGDVERFLNEADVRIDQFSRIGSARATGFVPSDFVTVYWALRAIAGGHFGPCHSFCEWGSGFGVVAALAALLDFDACGIEINGDLVELSQTLADDFDIPVEFIHGSFIPPGGESVADEVFTADSGDIFWLETDSDNAYDQLGLDPDDFDLIFAYPWPGEERVIDQLFEHFAANGAMLLTHNQHDTVRLQRKTSSCV